MTYKDFYMLFGEAAAENEKERYVSEWSNSIIFIHPDSENVDFDAIISDLSNIWDVAHLTFNDIRLRSGLTQAAFATRFCVPRRTVEDWCRLDCCPIYVKLMLCDLLRICTVQRSV